jgi:hypothetical protein
MTLCKDAVLPITSVSAMQQAAYLLKKLELSVLLLFCLFVQLTSHSAVCNRIKLHVELNNIYKNNVA